MSPSSLRLFGSLAVQLVIVAHGQLLATEEASPRFLSANGQRLAEDWRAEEHAVSFLIIGGFRSDGHTGECVRQAGAICRRFPGANVVIVDWYNPPRRESPASPFGPALFTRLFALYDEYQDVVADARRVAAETAAWMERVGICPSRTVITGHSLGAQIGAFISNEVSNPERLGKPVHAIIAADPAGPFFETASVDQRLDPTDAVQVIVIHTTEALGDENRIGSVDIFVEWPDNVPDNPIARHSDAFRLVTQSFQDPGLCNADNTPFGFNALSYEFRSDESRVFRHGAVSTTPQQAVALSGP